MIIYAYGAPGTKDDATRTEENFAAYAACGFDTLFLTGNNMYDGVEPWEKSNAKTCFDLARKVGIKNFILRDKRLYLDLIELKDKLLGDSPDCKFSTEKELDAYVENCMKDYVSEEGFIGLGLRDEPSYVHLKSLGQVYRSIKRTAKKFGKDDINVQMNLLPIIPDCGAICPPGYENASAKEVYEAYLNATLDETGADVVTVDNYPFRVCVEGGRFLEGYYTCFDILAKVCARRGAKMGFVLQSFEMIHKTLDWANAGFRRLRSYNEMLLQTNSSLGFGAKELSFFTYETKLLPPSSPYAARNGSSFVTDKGEKTRIYDFGKAAMAHAHKIGEVLKDYSYVGANISVGENMKKFADVYYGRGAFAQFGFDNINKFECLKSAKNDSDVMLITESKNEKDGSLIYMVQNVADPIYKTDTENMRVSLNFGAKCKELKLCRDGCFVLEKTVGGVYETTLAVGEAVWLMPTK